MRNILIEPKFRIIVAPNTKIYIQEQKRFLFIFSYWSYNRSGYGEFRKPKTEYNSVTNAQDSIDYLVWMRETRKAIALENARNAQVISYEANRAYIK